MVAKIGRGNHLKGVLIYNYEKVENDKGNVLFCNKIIEPINGNFSIPLLEKSFENYLIANNKTEKPILHISLNPNPKDDVSDEQFEQIAQKYMKEMGYGNQPYVVFSHTDIARKHIHIVSVCVDEHGKRISDSFEKRRSMKVCRDLEKQFGLLPAISSDDNQELIPLNKVDATQSNLKKQIASVLYFVNDNYHFQTLGEYKAILSFFNITAEEVKGQINGQEKKGLVYFATDDKGEKTSHAFKSSRFSGEFGLSYLEKKYQKSKAFIDKNKPQKHLREVVSKALQNSKNQQEFKRILEQQKVSVFIRENEQGRIYGITFIDHTSKSVMNGSRLGKDCSANVFHQRWNEITNEPNQENTPPTQEFSANENHKQQEFSPQYDEHSWEGLGWLFPTDIPEENDNYLPKKKQKKKKNAKRR